ncbi:MAG: hypothetical protein GX638_19625 [Crenarchaeota archaeon]|nr:hypothetical protein [Thermoproteota archaeon]
MPYNIENPRNLLNVIYQALHEKAKVLLKAIRGMGYTANLHYCNLHESLVNGCYAVEYFPLPEIEISGLTESADLGIALDGSAWLELTLKKADSLMVDYERLAGLCTFEIYGAFNYREDFYRPGMDPGMIKPMIKESKESEVHINFLLEESSEEAVASLFSLLEEMRLAKNGLKLRDS